MDVLVYFLLFSAQPLIVSASVVGFGLALALLVLISAVNFFRSVFD